RQPIGGERAAVRDGVQEGGAAHPRRAEEHAGQGDQDQQAQVGQRDAEGRAEARQHPPRHARPARSWFWSWHACTHRPSWFSFTIWSNTPLSLKCLPCAAFQPPNFWMSTSSSFG